MRVSSGKFDLFTHDLLPTVSEEREELGVGSIPVLMQYFPVVNIGL